MTTWTDSAKTTLEGHLARMQHTLVASGADPAEVTDDLRRHIDEEVVSQRIGVVTTEDVERILQRIGLPPAPFLERNIAKPPQPSPQLDGERPAVPDPDQMRQTPAPGIRPARKWHGWLFFFGVGLPALTLLIELATHMCAGAFFDPIPDIWHVLMVASVPLVNFFVWRSVCRKRPGSMGLDVASAFSIGVATYFSLLYLPLAPIALFAIIVFGWGLLPLSPMFALISAWRLRVLMGKIEPHGRHSRWAGFAWGAGLAALTVGLVVFPPLLTRHWSYRVVDGDADESARALWWLRAVGNERTLLADSYGTVRWSRDNPFGFNVQGNPVPAEVARGIYYRVTGHAFNEFPPPQLNYVSRNWDVFGDFSWDGDQGGTAVGGRLRGLSLGQSRLDGLVDGDAGWAYTEWILEFKNVSEAAREARAQIVLPPGGVVGRQTHAGPMARFVEDLISALPIIAGPDPLDPDAESIALEDPATVDVTKLRVGYFTDSGKRRAASEMVRAVQSATKALSDSGLKCQSARPPGLDTSGQLLGALNSADGGEYYRQLLRQHGTTNLHTGTSNFLSQITGTNSGQKQVEVLLALKNLRETNLKFMRDFEILLCPPCSDVAPKPQQSGLLDYSYSSFFNLLGWPAAVVRVGRTSSGLPKGVQVVGRPWKDHEVLAVALFLEKKLGGWKPDFREDTFVGPKA